MSIVIASNSVILRNILSDILEDAKYKVEETTSSGKRVLDIVENGTIDLIILGENLAEISENDVVSRLFESTAILAFGSSNKLKKLGATEVIKKPSMEEINDKGYIKYFLSVVKKCIDAPISRKKLNHNPAIKHIVIGSSTGGPNALKEILSALPENFPVPISIVQHLEEGHEEGLASWLNSNCKLNVRIAINNDIPKAGEVILGIQNKHLTVRDGTYYLTDEKKINFQKPSIDLQFSTAAKYYKSNLLAILLTGMGSDGARGCLDVIKHGGITVVQDEATSTVYGMPKAAAELGAASVILPLNKIGEYLIQLVKGSSSDNP